MQGENYNRNGVLAVCEQKLEKTDQNDRSRNEDCNEFTFHSTIYQNHTADGSCLTIRRFFCRRAKKVGIIGINGTGKSTLLKIMAGLEETDEGTVTKANHAVIACPPQHPVFDPEMTALDCVLAGHRELSGPESGQAEERDHQDEAALVTKAKTMLTKLGVSNFDREIGRAIRWTRENALRW